MTLDQVEGLGDELFSEVNGETAQIAIDLFEKIKSLNCDEKKYLKLYINTKFSMERSGCVKIFKNINTALNKIFRELRDIKKKAFIK
jgi:hypothetical protein